MAERVEYGNITLYQMMVIRISNYRAAAGGGGGRGARGGVGPDYGQFSNFHV